MTQLAFFSIEPERCPCGWLHECVYWCGSGHDNGKCPEFPVRWRIPEDEMKEYSGTAHWQLNPCERCKGFHPRHCDLCWGDSPTCADHECSWPEDDDD